MTLTLANDEYFHVVNPRHSGISTIFCELIPVNTPSDSCYHTNCHPLVVCEANEEMRYHSSALKRHRVNDDAVSLLSSSHRAIKQEKPSQIISSEEVRSAHVLLVKLAGIIRTIGETENARSKRCVNCKISL